MTAKSSVTRYWASYPQEIFRRREVPYWHSPGAEFFRKLAHMANVSYTTSSGLERKKARKCRALEAMPTQGMEKFPSS